MTPILVDSDILIDIIRERDRSLIAQWIEISDSEQELIISPVSIAELWQGVRPHETQSLTKFLDSLTCLPIDHETGRLAGRFLNQYRKTHNLDVPDMLIAAGAILHHAHLWTRNREHYPMPVLTFY